MADPVAIDMAIASTHPHTAMERLFIVTILTVREAPMMYGWSQALNNL
jgi:hypothetical protein